MFRTVSCRSLVAASSVVTSSRVLMIFRSCACTLERVGRVDPRRTSGGKAKNEMTCVQARRHQAHRQESPSHLRKSRSAPSGIVLAAAGIPLAPEGFLLAPKGLRPRTSRNHALAPARLILAPAEFRARTL